LAAGVVRADGLPERVALVVDEVTLQHAAIAEV
jgi:hypothetical protein